MCCCVRTDAEPDLFWFVPVLVVVVTDWSVGTSLPLWPPFASSVDSRWSADVFPVVNVKRSQTDWCRCLRIAVRSLGKLYQRLFALE